MCPPEISAGDKRHPARHAQPPAHITRHAHPLETWSATPRFPGRPRQSRTALQGDAVEPAGCGGGRGGLHDVMGAGVGVAPRAAAPPPRPRMWNLVLGDSATARPLPRSGRRGCRRRPRRRRRPPCRWHRKSGGGRGDGRTRIRHTGCYPPPPGVDGPPPQAGQSATPLTGRPSGLPPPQASRRGPPPPPPPASPILHGASCARPRGPAGCGGSSSTGGGVSCHRPSRSPPDAPPPAPPRVTRPATRVACRWR